MLAKTCKFFSLVSFIILMSAFTPVSELGGAYLTFNDKFGGEIPQQELTTCQEVKIVGCAAGSKILQINLHIHTNGKTITHKSDSGKLTPEMLKDLQTLSKGDSFEFKKVKARMPNKLWTIDVATRKFMVV